MTVYLWLKSWRDAYRAYKRGERWDDFLTKNLPPEQRFDNWDGRFPGQERPPR